jgi:chromosome segregation ATPase
MIDAESLKETLRALAETLPSVPARLTGLVAEGQALRGAAEEAARELREHRQQAEDALARVDTALGELRDGAAAREALFEQGLGALPPALTSSLAAVPLVGPLVAQATSVDFTTLKQAPTVLRATQDEAERALASVQEGITAGEGTLSATLEEVGRAEEACRVHLEAAQAGLTERVHGLVQAMESRQGETLERLGVASEVLASLEADFHERLTAVNERIIQARTSELLDETRDRAAELQQQIESALAQVTDTLKDLSQELRHAQDDAAHGRDVLAPLFSELQRRLEPLRRAVQSVKEAAEEVGLPL